jgi:hypothetical protein
MLYKIVRARSFPTMRIDSCIKQKRRTRILFAALAVAFIAVSASCSRKEAKQPGDRPLSDNERYLVEVYARIQRARAFYPAHPEIAESLFAALDSTTDTTRVANTIRETNRTPERWAAIFKAIDQALREPGEPERSEQTGRGS